MSDGANMGVTAERAIETILGGKEPPTPDEGMTREQMRAMLEAKDDSIDTYDGHAQVMAKYILAALCAPDRLIRELHLVPTEGIYGYENRETREGWKQVCPGLSDVLKAHVYTDPDHPFRRALSAATGFTWGWAVNAARYALGLPPVANPAILEIHT